jgi:hypothetical protein
MQKPGSGGAQRNDELTVAKVTQLLEAYILNKKQWKKLWHIVASEEGLWDYHC